MSARADPFRGTTLMSCRLRNNALCCCALETQLVAGMVLPHPYRSSDVCSDDFKLDSQDPGYFVGDRL